MNQKSQKKNKPIISFINFMATSFVLLITIMSTNIFAQTTLIKFTFNGLPGGVNAFGASPYTPVLTDANITAVGLTRGTGLGTSGTAAGNAWGGTAANTVANQSAAITNNNFITFSIKANTGYNLSLTQIPAYNIRRSGSGFSVGIWQYSINGGSFTDIGSAITWGSTTTSSGNAQTAVNLTNISALQNVAAGNNITIRLVLWGASGTTGTWYFNQPAAGINELIVNGIVASTPVTPTPTCSANITASGATTFCQGGNVTLKANSGSSYLWSNGATTQSISVTASGTYTVKVIDAGSTCTTTSNPVVIAVKPTYTTLINTSKNPICLGETVTLNGVTLNNDLLISEYVEGSSFNKYIEIYNGTGASVNLADYRYQGFQNGSNTPSYDIQLSGTLLNGSTIIYSNSQSSIYAGQSTTLGAVQFNGDDAIALYKISTASYVDIFGVIGQDPGTAWTNGSYSTLDKTLRRKSTIHSGVTVNPVNGFSTLATEWDIYNMDVVSGLGSHTVNVNYTWSNSSTNNNIIVTPTVGSVYNLSGTDLNGCTSSSSISINVTNMVASSSVSSILCNGGNASVNISATGGTLPYTGTGNFTVVAGSYSYIVTDANGCSANTSVLVIQPTALSLNLTTSNYNGYGVSCNGNNDGSVSTSVSGGVSPYSYIWSNNSINSTISNLISANYNVLVTDANGCKISDSAFISEPSVLSINLTVSNYNGFGVSCNGGNNGSISSSLNGGVTPYIYNWTNNDTTANISNLTAGNYNVLVTDANGCMVSDSKDIYEPAALSNNLIVSNFNGYGVSCNGSNDGSISTSVNGGVGPYTYNWSTNDNSSAIYNVITGNYNVVVTDANGCTVSTNAFVSEPTALNLSLSTSNFNGFGVSCNGGNNGTISTSLSGGVGPYTYIWSTNDTTANIGNLFAGSYNLIVADANGCMVGGMQDIYEPTALSNNLTTSSFNGYGVSCNGGNNGSVSTAVGGGVTPYTYSWNNGSTNSGISGLTAGNYNVTVVDANGCTIGGNATITEPTALSIAMGPNQVVYYGYAPSACANITGVVSGGVSAYAYSWSSGSNNSSATVCPSVTTTYTLTATDANGCIISGEVKVCAINVICYAGNSNVAKVQVCHIPPGNNQNPQTICINASAVPAHLAQGAYLGSCGVITACNSNRLSTELVDENSSSITEFHVYPNPTNDNLTFEYHSMLKGSATIEIKDVVSRILMTSNETISEDNQTRVNSISVKDYAPGIYFITITNDGKTQVKKFIVQK